MAKTKKDKKTEDKAVKDEVMGEAGKATNTKEEKSSKAEKKDSPKKKKKVEISSEEESADSADSDSDSQPKKKAVTKKKEKKETKKKDSPKKETSKKESPKKDKKDKKETLKKKPKKESSEESESEADESEESGSDSEEETPKKATDNGTENNDYIKLNGADAKKRKAEAEEGSNKVAKQTPSFNSGGSVVELYVGNVSFDANESELRTMFEEFGEITRLDWKTDRDTGKFSGFGYLAYNTNEAAEKCAQALNGKMVSGRPLRVEPSSGKAGPKAGPGGAQSSTPAETIFVGNLPADVTQEEVSEFFSTNGTIVDVRFVTDRTTGEFKRCAFVEFEDDTAAAKVFQSPNTSIRGCELRLDYANKKTGDRGGRGGGGGGGFGGGGRGGRGGGRGGRGGGGGRRW